MTPLTPFYKETSIKYNTSSAQESLRGCTGTMHVIKFYIFFIIIIFFHLSFIRSFTLKKGGLYMICMVNPPIKLVDVFE